MEGDSQSRSAGLARGLSALVTVAALALLAGTCLAAVSGSLHGGWFSVDVGGAASPGHARIVSVASGVVMVAALVTFRSALRLVAGDQPFGPGVLRRVRLTAKLMCVASALSLLMPPLLDWIDARTRTRGLTLTFSGSDLAWLVSALTFYMMSALVGRAAEYETDSRAFV